MNPPRKHKKGRGHWPDYLTTVKRKNGELYYVYKHPKLDKAHGFGYDMHKAFAAAKQLNAQLNIGKDLIEAVINQPSSDSVSGYIKYFKAIKLPQRLINGFPLSPATLAEYNRMCNLFCDEWENKNFSTLSQADIADYLNKQSTAHVHNKHRSLLVTIWKHAISDGKTKLNLPKMIVKRDKERKRRDHLDMDQYKAIYQKAEPEIQNAMELAINLIQRRTDIKHLKFTDVRDDEHLYIIQSKTRKHGKAAYLRIPVNLPLVHSDRGCKTLKQLIESCRDIVLSPYVVHKKYKRIKANKERDHHTQLTLKNISDGFSKARDKTDLFTGWPVEQKPTYHEIIGLGEFQRLESGWTLKQIQSLRGHSKESTTLIYLEGHSWSTVSVPGL